MSALLLNKSYLQELVELSKNQMLKDCSNEAKIETLLALTKLNLLNSDQFRQIFSHIQTASSNNNGLALYVEGLMYQSGIGIEQDLNLSQACIQYSAHKYQCSPALVYLGLQHAKNDQVEAFSLINKAYANNDYPRAAYLVGTMRLYGLGIEQSYPESIIALSKSGNLGVELLTKITEHVARSKRDILNRNIHHFVRPKSEVSAVKLTA